MRIMNSPKVASIAQNTMMAVGIETCLKAVGRPTFTYLDPHADKDSKKFSATKELLYQSLCFGIYMAVIPLFQKGGFKAAGKIFKNDKAVTETIENIGKDAKVQGKSAFNVFMDGFSKLKNDENVPEYLKGKEAPMNKIKGSVEGMSIVGSIIGLTIVAPEISHIIIHPIMDALGIKSGKHAEANTNPSAQLKLEKQA